MPCCPLCALAMVTAAHHNRPGAQGKQQMREDSGEEAESSAKDCMASQTADPAKRWSPSGKWGCPGRAHVIESCPWLVALLAVCWLTLDQLLRSPSSLLPQPQNDLPPCTEAMRTYRADVPCLAYTGRSISGAIVILRVGWGLEKDKG